MILNDSHVALTSRIEKSKCHLMNFILFIWSNRRHAPVRTTVVNSYIVKACGIAFTIITLTAPPRPVSSGKRTIVTAKNGRNAEVQRPRYSSVCLGRGYMSTWDEVILKWNHMVDIHLFTGSPFKEWAVQTGRAETVHSSVESEARPSKRLASSPEPGEASGLMNCLPQPAVYFTMVDVKKQRKTTVVWLLRHSKGKEVTGWSFIATFFLTSCVRTHAYHIVVALATKIWVSGRSWNKYVYAVLAVEGMKFIIWYQIVFY